MGLPIIGESGVDVDADRLHAAAGELEDVGGARRGRQRCDCLRDLLLGADHEVDAQGALVDDALVAQVGGVVDAGHADDALRDGLGDETGDDVGLVAAGDGDEDVGGAQAGLEQDRGRAALADDGAHVHGVLRAPQGVLVLADEDDVVPLLGEPARDVEAQRPGARDDDLHARRPASCAGRSHSPVMSMLACAWTSSGLAPGTSARMSAFSLPGGSRQSTWSPGSRTVSARRRWRPRRAARSPRGPRRAGGPREGELRRRRVVAHLDLDELHVLALEREQRHELVRRAARAGSSRPSWSRRRWWRRRRAGRRSAGCAGC